MRDLQEGARYEDCPRCGGRRYVDAGHVCDSDPFDVWWNEQFWDTTLGGTDAHYLHCREAWRACERRRARRVK